MTSEIPDDTGFRVARIIYMTLLVLGCPILLLFLIFAIGFGLLLMETHVALDEADKPMTPEQREEMKMILILFSMWIVLFVCGVFKQILSWIAILKFNICCILTGIALDIVTFVILLIRTLVYTSSKHTISDKPGLRIFCLSLYFIDTICLIYIFVRIQQHNKY